jgi:C-terminal processing protease CtpA/Prc
MLPKDGVFEVGFVSPGSPADKAGLKAGDRIRLINHKPPSAWPHDVLTRLSEEAAGTRVELTMADGKVRRLTLRDYF